ncbi:hypothetical protein ElyMa_001458800 [Elysia marginata]|uniref:Uncharacterized protein n=1 Tax=Elysia marginata TaxID=1093978 RepID=A0AAV4J0B1_9GAST|nr:hypothetical protein ElyMa_001458800 [Elysia marginata]
MCVNSLSQGLNVDLPKAGLEPRTSRSESRASTTTPRRHTMLPQMCHDWQDSGLKSRLISHMGVTRPSMSCECPFRVEATTC